MAANMDMHMEADEGLYNNQCHFRTIIMVQRHSCFITRSSEGLFHILIKGLPIDTSFWFRCGFAAQSL